MASISLSNWFVRRALEVLIFGAAFALSAYVEGGANRTNILLISGMGLFFGLFFQVVCLHGFVSLAVYYLAKHRGWATGITDSVLFIAYAYAILSVANNQPFWITEITKLSDPQYLSAALVVLFHLTLGLKGVAQPR